LNILIGDLPTAVLIGDTEYPIETDFRACLRVIMAYEDNELTPQEKQIILLSNLYPRIPSDVEAAIKKAQLFLNGGESSEDAKEGPRVCSFLKDANFIFAAFKQTHGIDLDTVELHWWKFIALFMDLGQDTTFCQLTALRSRLATGKATKEERAIAHKLGDLINLPEIDTRTLAEKELAARFEERVNNVKKAKENQT
jgi:hypothetical protein